MHYFAAVIIPNNEDVYGQVVSAMAPYDETLNVKQETTEDGETHWYNPAGMWDWWQIGGRWTGVWSGYDPCTDPANIETCDLCAGTGYRNDEVAQKFRAKDPTWSCNGCEGTGRSVKWPTQWQEHPGDIIPVSDLLNKSESDVPHSLVIPDGFFAPDQSFCDDPVDKEWCHKFRELLAAHRDHFAVVVDYHC